LAVGKFEQRIQVARANRKDNMQAVSLRGQHDECVLIPQPISQYSMERILCRAVVNRIFQAEDLLTIAVDKRLLA